MGAYDALATRGGYVPSPAASPLVSETEKNSDTSGYVAMLLGGVVLAAVWLNRKRPEPVDENAALHAKINALKAEQRRLSEQLLTMPSSSAPTHRLPEEAGPMTTRTGTMPELDFTFEDAEQQRRYLLPPATERFPT